MTLISIQGVVGGLDNVAGLGSTTRPQGTTEEKASFADMVKNVATTAVETSRAADNASVAAVQGTMSDIELSRVMNEAQMSLEKFTTAFDAMKQSLDKVLNTQI